MADGITVRLTVTSEEVEKLLDLLGHDNATAEDWDLVSLIRSLYRHRLAFADRNPPSSLDLEASQKQLDLIHRYFTPAAFGQGGREFRLKLAQAYVAIERFEDIPDIEEAAPLEMEEFGAELRQRLSQWEQQTNGSESPAENQKGEVKDA